MVDQEVDHDEKDASNTDEEQPSLNLDQALQYIAAERANLSAPRDYSVQWGDSSTSDDPSSRRRQQPPPHQQQLTPRRMRSGRKPRTISVRESSGAAGNNNQNAAIMPEGNDPSSPDITSSEAAIRFRSSSASPHRKVGRRVRSASIGSCSQLGHSKSTPTLHTSPLDLRIVRLRALANKLKFLFTAETELLTAVLSSDSLQSPSPGFIDPRGPPPRPGQPLVHVFIN